MRGSVGSARDSWAKRATRVLFAASCGAAALVFLDYGITWDEGVQSRYGELALEYFRSLGSDRRVNEYLDLRFYGPLFETVLAAVYEPIGRFKYEIRHAGIALAALSTLLAVARLGRMVASARVGFFGMLALATMPCFVGHSFNNSKDIPFACAFAWGMVALAGYVTRSDRGPGRAWATGVALGLALSVRTGAFLLYGLLMVGLLAALALRSERLSWRERPGRRLVELAIIVSVSWSIMVAFWPFTHASPILRPLAAFHEMSHFQHGYSIFFEGRVLRSDQLPWTYLPKYLGITTPVFLLFLFGVGLIVAMFSLARRRPGPRAVILLLLAIWVLFPLTYFVLRRPNVYDGVRHFLFLLPAAAVFCGMGADWTLGRCRGRAKPLVLAALLAAMAFPLRDVVILHPYQSSYFNAAVGGTRSAWHRYETDSWTSSYREAMLWVLDDARKHPGQETIVLVACNEHNRTCASYYVETAFEETEAPKPVVRLECVWYGNETPPPGAHYFVSTLRYGKAKTFFPGWPQVHEISRDGAVFAVIKRNPRGTSRGGGPPAPPPT